MTFECEFCRRSFARESTIAVHMCEPKRRRLEVNERGVQLAFQGYLRFYEILQGSARTRTFEDFCDSPYYKAMVRWGRYCVNARVINPRQFLEWLLKNNRKIDRWASDSVYTEYLVKYLQSEAMEDALSRAVEWAEDWSQKQSANSRDCLRFGNDNVICHAISTGQLSPWVIYNCDSGQEFLSRLDPKSLEMIWSYVDTDVWQRRFREYPADQTYAQEILRQAGW